MHQATRSGIAPANSPGRNRPAFREHDGTWVLLRAGPLVVATLATRLSEDSTRLVLGVALGGADASV